NPPNQPANPSAMPAAAPNTPRPGSPPAGPDSSMLRVTPSRHAGLGHGGLVVVLGQMHVVDRHIDLDDLKARGALHGRDDVLADVVRHIGDRDPVLDDEVEIDGRLALADLDLD